ncbi:MAG TPA: hypothetical protein VKT83_06145 [bacterium]|nr:hypothetical protein [bacterium]
MALHTYADESGTHDETGLQPGAEVAVVAGYVAEQERWGELSRLWRKALDDEGLKAFHASNLLGPRGLSLSSDWTQKRIDAFVFRLIEITRETALFGAAGLLQVQHYNEIVPARLRADIQHPYYFSFQVFLAKALQVLNEDVKPPMPPGQNALFVFEQQDEFQDIAFALYNQFRRERDPHQRLGAVMFAAKDQYLQLHAADLLAYRLRKMLVRKVAGKTVISAGSWDDALRADRNILTSYFAEPELRRMVEYEMTRRGYCT